LAAPAVPFADLTGKRNSYRGYRQGVPTWIARRAVPWIWKKVPWKTVWTITLWLAQKGRDRVRQNLTEKEQSEFWSLLKKSHGNPGNLGSRDRARVKDIVGKAIRG
jgi:hypothetical protein